MIRRLPYSLGAVAVAALAASPIAAQSHDHGAGHAHDHSGPIVSCTDLVTPPWQGLPASDRAQILSVQQSLAHLSTPEAALAAGFVPVLGNIPGMGVHYIHNGRMQRPGIEIDEPDHLLFAPLDGREQLVGAAYAFLDVVETDQPIPFESDLAAWHDHPEFATPGQTLHMLHVWFVPSSNGPFAGLNFWLPFHAVGITPPNACWMAEESERIQQVAFALAVTSRSSNSSDELLARFRGMLPQPTAEQQARRAELVANLDAAATADDQAAWGAAADAYLADLTRAERAVVQRVLETLTMAQMSTPEREATRQ